MLVKSGMEGRYSDKINVTESFAVNGTGQLRGYQRTGWEQSAALITAVPARAPARSAGVGQQIYWECSRPTLLTNEGYRRSGPPCAYRFRA